MHTVAFEWPGRIPTYLRAKTPGRVTIGSEGRDELPETVVFDMDFATPFGCNGSPLCVTEALPLGFELIQACRRWQTEEMVHHMETCNNPQTMQKRNRCGSCKEIRVANRNVGTPRVLESVQYHCLHQTTAVD